MPSKVGGVPEEALMMMPVEGFVLKPSPD